MRTERVNMHSDQSRMDIDQSTVNRCVRSIYPSYNLTQAALAMRSRAFLDQRGRSSAIRWPRRGWPRRAAFHDSNVVCLRRQTPSTYEVGWGNFVHTQTFLCNFAIVRDTWTKSGVPLPWSISST